MAEQDKVNMILRDAVFAPNPRLPSIVFSSEDGAVVVDISPVPFMVNSADSETPLCFSCVTHGDKSIISDDLKCVPYIESAVCNMLAGPDECLIPVRIKVLKTPQESEDSRVYYTAIIMLPDLGETVADSQVVN